MRSHIYIMQYIFIYASQRCWDCVVLKLYSREELPVCLKIMEPHRKSSAPGLKIHQKHDNTGCPTEHENFLWVFKKQFSHKIYIKKEITVWIVTFPKYSKPYLYFKDYNVIKCVFLENNMQHSFIDQISQIWFLQSRILIIAFLKCIMPFFIFVFSKLRKKFIICVKELYMLN